MLDPVVGGSDAGREQAGAAVGAVHVEPQLVLPRDGGHAGQVVDDAGVGGARGGHHRGERFWVTVFADGFAEGWPGELMVGGGHDQ